MAGTVDVDGTEAALLLGADSQGSINAHLVTLSADASVASFKLEGITLLTAQGKPVPLLLAAVGPAAGADVR